VSKVGDLYSGVIFRYLGENKFYIYGKRHANTPTIFNEVEEIGVELGEEHYDVEVVWLPYRPVSTNTILEVIALAGLLFDLSTNSPCMSWDGLCADRRAPWVQAACSLIGTQAC